MNVPFRSLSQHTATAVPTATPQPSRLLSGWFSCLVPLRDGSELRIVSKYEDGSWLHYVPRKGVRGVPHEVTLNFAQVLDLNGALRVTAEGDCDCPNGKSCVHVAYAALAERYLQITLYDIAIKSCWSNSTSEQAEAERLLAAIQWQPEQEEVA